ncbi:MAG: hypothetical protein HYV32_06095 [Candidatus Kerfeldbacteria bacterium]|nr:hypothetical protein [Candidatus Kerfeldbacteria bacterium]
MEALLGESAASPKKNRPELSKKLPTDNVENAEIHATEPHNAIDYTSPSESNETWQQILDALREANAGVDHSVATPSNDLETLGRSMREQLTKEQANGGSKTKSMLSPDEVNAIAAALEEPTGLLDGTFEPQDLLDMTKEKYDAWEKKQALEEDPEDPTFSEGER